VSDTPETDGLTVGCSFGPFVEALAEHARKLERERDLLKLENATLKRQVGLVIKNRAEMEDCWNCPVYTGAETLTCETREKCEEHISKWSLEQAKGGE
jgi:hypothetical protein